MSRTNCVNCGAAKDINEIKCPHCGTTYLDLTMIDFTSDAPVVCKFVLPVYGKKAVLSMLAKPKLEEMTVHTNFEDVIHNGTKLCKHTLPSEDSLGLSFSPIMRPDKPLMELEVQKKEPE